jgi:uncharacterized cysteine cluster protein YcgN (CxxCxxCC family)
MKRILMKLFSSLKQSIDKNPKSFWEVKSLEEMNKEEWESLCDGCGKCCLFKIEDEATGEVFYTDVACRMLNLETCRCKLYEHRFEVVKDCLSLDYGKLLEIDWLPESCAYRRLKEGRGLARWHPLISGDPDSVRQAGISVCGRVVTESSVNLNRLQERVVDWINES